MGLPSCTRPSNGATGTHQELQVGQVEAGRALQVRDQAPRGRNHDVRATAVAAAVEFRL